MVEITKMKLTKEQQKKQEEEQQKKEEQRKIKNNQSLAERKRMLFKKKKGIFKEYYDTREFKEPILILMRRTQNAEFFEKATQGEFEYEHSDGTTRRIMLNSKYLQSFPYGKRTFKGYICHEDAPLPLPNEPEVSVETMGIAIDKTLNDIKKWTTQEIKAKGQLVWKIALGIMGILGVYILYKMLVPANAGNTATEVQVIKDTTITLTNLTPTVIG